MLMKLSDIGLPVGYKKKKRKRVGRGTASGWGCTAGRGQKGQKARSGGYHKVGFEGGQMPLQRRMPKRGFTNIFKKRYAVINVERLSGLPAGTDVDAAYLKKHGMIKKIGDGLKILGKGSISVPLKVKVSAITNSAKSKIESAGGTVEVISV